LALPEAAGGARRAGAAEALFRPEVGAAGWPARAATPTRQLILGGARRGRNLPAEVGAAVWPARAATPTRRSLLGGARRAGAAEALPGETSRPEVGALLFRFDPAA